MSSNHSTLRHYKILVRAGGTDIILYFLSVQYGQGFCVPWLNPPRSDHIHGQSLFSGTNANQHDSYPVG